MPAHQRLPEDDTDEELTHEQVRELLDEAERRMCANAGSQPTTIAGTPFKLPKLSSGPIADSCLKIEGSITRLDSSRIINKKDLALANGVKKIEDPVVKKPKAEKADAGPDWFNLPRTELTPELRQDLKLLKMRNVLDPKRFYKKSDSKSDVPAFSQVGTIVEGPTEYYNSRLKKKDRKRTFIEEVLAQEGDSGKFKKRYEEILKSKASGRKAFYKALKAKRRKGKVVDP